MNDRYAEFFKTSKESSSSSSQESSSSSSSNSSQDSKGKDVDFGKQSAAAAKTFMSTESLTGIWKLRFQQLNNVTDESMRCSFCSFIMKMNMKDTSENIRPESFFVLCNEAGRNVLKYKRCPSCLQSEEYHITYYYKSFLSGQHVCRCCKRKAEICLIVSKLDNKVKHVVCAKCRRCDLCGLSLPIEKYKKRVNYDKEQFSLVVLDLFRQYQPWNTCPFYQAFDVNTLAMYVGLAHTVERNLKVDLDLKHTDCKASTDTKAIVETKAHAESKASTVTEAHAESKASAKRKANQMEQTAPVVINCIEVSDTTENSDVRPSEPGVSIEDVTDVTDVFFR